MFNSLFSCNRTLKEQLVLFGTGLPWFFLLPFSIYRFSIGDYAIGAIDLLISVSLFTIFYQTLSGKKVKYLDVLAVSLCLMGVVWVLSMRGLGMAYWAFPAIGFTYFVLKSKEALALNIVFMIGITVIFFNVMTKDQALSIYPSLVLVCTFGFAFSLCAESQNKKLMSLVTEDPLTGVNNRRSFDDKVEEILANYRRNNVTVSMLILDLDHFKKINDSYGHKRGDQVLIDFAEKVKSIIRTTDYIYRFGGEEFVVIANNSTLENSGKLADSIREFIAQTPSLAKYKVTVSIGVSEVVDTDDADSWFRRADRALYDAKETGRNRVCLAEAYGSTIVSNEVYNESISNFRKIKPTSESSHELLRHENNSADATFSTSVTPDAANSRADTGQGINLK